MADAAQAPAPPRAGDAEAGAGARRASRRARESVRRSPSPLTRRIVAFNLIGLGLLVLGVLLLNDYRSQLIELRTQALETQGEIIAITLAESATLDDGEIGIDPEKAVVVIDRLVEPAQVRAQIFDRAGRLMHDTGLRAGNGGAIEVETLPSDRFPEASGPLAWLDAGWRALNDALRRDVPRQADDVLGGVASAQEVYAALAGEVARGERINNRDELIVSVSSPIMHLKKVHGVLVLSTRGGDIDAIAQSERISVLQVFLVALAVSIVLSILLANAIARPIQRLAEAALMAERGEGGQRSRVAMPDLTDRSDEIGYLSGALKRMTNALYSRIDATESFAADVAHEIKNPLTSLRSAVETLRLAPTDQARERLMQVIQTDVARLDRLVTDISNASRLDAELVREERDSFDLGAMLRGIVDFTRVRASERGVRIVFDLRDEPLMLRGIEGRLAQVFVNLIENAISFAPDGSRILVAARTTPDGKAICVEVEDEGPGIPDANLGSVFERFYSERPEQEAFGNHSGLGLSISRQIVEAHRGDIRAENVGPVGDPRRGARFVVELPL